jgi:hypothetical protein
MLSAYFGGLAWRFYPADALAFAQLRECYGAYQPHGDTAAPIVTCHVASVPSPSGVILSPHLEVERTESALLVRRGDFHGRIDLYERHLEFEYCGRVPSLHAFLRVANALLLAEIDGLLLHASSVLRRGRAFLFPGPSGAGKTAISRLAAGGGVLSDEVSAVRRVGSTFFCYSTPFFGEYEGAGMPAECAPLERVCFPAKTTTRNALAPTTTAEAAQLIMRSVYRHGADAAMSAQMFETSSHLAASVRCGWLEFRPDTASWSVIDG